MSGAAATIAAELRAGYAASWVLRGIDRAAVFGDDLARRGVTTLAGATLVQAGTVRTPGTAYDGATQTFPDVDLPVYSVQFAGRLLGYGDGFKGYAEATLKPISNSLARDTAGEGAVQLRVIDLGGGRAGFVPFWQETSDQDDAIAIVAGVGIIVTAGLLAGAAPGLGAAEAIGGLDAVAAAEAGAGTLTAGAGAGTAAGAAEAIGGLDAVAAAEAGAGTLTAGAGAGAGSSLVDQAIAYGKSLVTRITGGLITGAVKSALAPDGNGRTATGTGTADAGGGTLLVLAAVAVAVAALA